MTAARPEHYERLLWLQPDWLARATRWVRDQLEERGILLAGEIDQPHVRPWSTVLRVPTSEGDLYFKAATEVSRFEAGLTAALGRLDPDRVPEVVAFEPEAGWMLTRDGGTRLRELLSSVTDLRRWEELLPGYAELQIELAAHVDELLALGVPDERLAAIPQHLERLLDDREALLIDLPDGLTTDEYEQMRARAPEVVALCRELATYGIPETIQHDDFNDGQIFLRDGRYRFFDWGDSCVSHPFHTLVVTLRSITHRFDLEPGGPELERLRDAYLEPFSRYGRPVELAAAVNVAYQTGTLARALAWYRYVSTMEPPFRAEFGDAVPYGIQRFLAGGPIGSWS
jgi:phosphotransferase family enzyme